MKRSLLPFACLLFLSGPVLAAAPDPAIAFSKLRSARSAKDFAQAEKVARELIAAYPTSSEAYIERAMTYLSQQKRELAAVDFKKAVEVDPTNPRAYLYRGDLAYRLIEKNYAGCEADYATVLKLDPDFPGYRAYTAELYLYMKDPARVITEAAIGLAAEPTHAIHRVNLAHGLAFSGQMAAAKALYTQLASEEIAHGRKGAAFVLGDFATLKRHGIEYPQAAELTPFLEALKSP